MDSAVEPSQFATVWCETPSARAIARRLIPALRISCVRARLGASRALRISARPSRLSPAGRTRRERMREESGRAASPVIVGAHVAGATERDEVDRGVIAGESIRQDVMDVERASSPPTTVARAGELSRVALRDPSAEA